MKKRLLLIPAGLLFFNLLFFTLSQYNDSKILFVFRHLSVFTIFGFIIVYFQINIKDKMLRTFKLSATREKVLKVTIGMSGILILVLLSNIQINFINKYEIPRINACDYYDQEGHIIYISKTQSCPEVDSYSFSNNILEASFFEEYGDTSYVTELKIIYSDNNMMEYVEETVKVEKNSIIEEFRFIQEISINNDGFTVTQQEYIKNTDWIETENIKYDVTFSNDLNIDDDILITQTINSVEETLISGIYFSDTFQFQYFNDGVLQDSFSLISKEYAAELPFDMDIHIGKTNSLLTNYGSVDYKRRDSLYYMNKYDTNIEYYIDQPENMSFMGYHFFTNTLQNDGYSYKSQTKLFIEEKVYGLTKVITYQDNGDFLYTDHDEDLLNRELFSQYDYKTRSVNMTDYTDYLIYRVNPLVDYVFIYIKENYNE